MSLLLVGRWSPEPCQYHAIIAACETGEQDELKSKLVEIFNKETASHAFLLSDEVFTSGAIDPLVGEKWT